MKKQTILKILDKIRIYSIRKSLKKEDRELMEELELIVPDISDQYSNLKINSNYLRLNIRAMHCFQIKLMGEYIRLLIKTSSATPEGSNKAVLNWFDIGDSSGNHILYIKKLFRSGVFGNRMNIMSINADYEACKKIRKKGLDAWMCTAERFARKIEDGEYIGLYPIVNNMLSNSPLFTLFEVLEHLENPIYLLRSLRKVQGSKIIITVPFLRKSRIGLHALRRGKGVEDIEDCHIFELSKEDWGLLFQYCGLKIEYEEVYYQYPRKSPFGWLWKSFWQRFDYEGFYGAILS